MAANEAFLARFVAGTQHDSGATAATHRSRILAALRRFEREEGYLPLLSDAVTNGELLGAILLCDKALDTDGRILRATINGTRNSFAALAAWLPSVGPREQARDALARARVISTRPCGLRRRTTAGRGGDTDGRHVPTADEIGLVIDCLRDNGEASASLTADVVALCYLTGLRIGAVLQLKRRDLVAMPDGRRWLTVTEKARHDRRQVELRGDRIGLTKEWEPMAPSTSLWLRDGVVLNYRLASKQLVRACLATGLPVFSFHRLRHAFASDVAVYMGLRGVMLSGGWLAEPVAQSYVSARAST